MTDAAATSQNGGEIVCRVTRWYYRRMGLLTAMFVGMGLFFFYDGKWGYPKKNQVAEKKEWFESEVVKSYEAAKAQGEEAVQEWLAEARQKQWVVSANLKEPRWDDYAAPHGWAADPKKYGADEIEQQFWWGGVVFAGGLVTGTLLLLNRHKTFRGGENSMTMPDGREVFFKQVFRVDKRKWDNKGLAYAYYREADGAPVKKAVIDDLKFGGADKVLTRLLENFSGELIEKVRDDEVEEEEGSEQQGESPPKIKE